MNILVNVDANWAIGYKGNLLFPISADLKRFARLTTGKVVIMGRATLESLPGGKPLKNRENIVLSRKARTCGTQCVLSVETAENLSFCLSVADLQKLLASRRFEDFSPQDIFVIGGQSVYQQLLESCDTALITKVEASAAQADSFFPNLDKLPQWQITETSEQFFQDKIPYRYITYRNQNAER